MDISTEETKVLAQHFRNIHYKFQILMDFPEDISHLLAVKLMREFENKLSKMNGTFFVVWDVQDGKEIDKKNGDNICVLIDTSATFRQLYKAVNDFNNGHPDMRFKVSYYKSTDRLINDIIKNMFLPKSKWNFFVGGKKKKVEKEGLISTAEIGTREKI